MFPDWPRKPFQKYDVSLPSITAPIKPYTSMVNHWPRCCCCRAKKLLPSEFFLPRQDLSADQKGAKVAPSIWCHKSNMMLHPTPRSPASYIICVSLVVGAVLSAPPNRSLMFSKSATFNLWFLYIWFLSFLCVYGSKYFIPFIPLHLWN